MLVRTIDVSLLWQELRFHLTYPKKTLCVNHCSEKTNGQTPAWLTNQHLAAFDQKCPRIMNLFYDLLVDFKPFPRILFSSSSNTGDQLFLATRSVSIILFSTKFRSTFFSVIVLYRWETQIYVSVWEKNFAKLLSLLP